MKRNRVPGHALKGEGRAYIPRGWTRERFSSVYGPTDGVAVCECDVESPVLPSNAERRRWHREHKAEIAGQPVSILHPDAARERESRQDAAFYREVGP